MGDSFMLSVKKLSMAMVLYSALGIFQLAIAETIDTNKAVFYPYLSINFGSLYDLDTESTLSSGADQKPKGLLDYNYSLGIGFDGNAPATAISPSFKLLYGGYFELTKNTQPLAKRFDDGYGNGIIGQFGAKSLYIGLGSSMGNLKFGNLSTNSLGLTPDFWSTGGVAGLTLYRRTFFPVANAILYESPNWDGLSFHLIRGIGKRVNGIYERIPNLPVAPSVESVKIYGGTVQQQKDGYFAKYTGLIRHDGLLDKRQSEAEQKNHAYLHRFEGGYNKNNWFISAGYQYLLNNAGWGDTLYAMPKNQQEALTGPEIGSATNYALPDRGMRYFAFPMHEIATSVSYTVGKFVPKISIVLGKSTKNTYESESDSASKFNLPGYVQGVVGMDYFVTDHIIVNLAYGQLNWLHDDATPETDKWFNQKTAALNLTYWY
ncbi:MAG: hypothetical protein IPK86_01865 [Neisseriales bacterium]|nr:MAG: hypothetical protein IPK86_01865 [Neisseriales bacterium]